MGTLSDDAHLFDPTNRTGKYVLDADGEPVAEPDLLAWATWFEGHDRQLLHDRVGDTRISTIFLALDHGLARILNPAATPVLWETMIVGPSVLAGFMWRYTSRLDALTGHVRAVALVERFGDPPRRLKKALRKCRHGVSRPGDRRRVQRWYARVHAYEHATSV